MATEAGSKVAEVAATTAGDESKEHALETAWCMWYDKKLPRSHSSSNYKDNLKKLSTFSTVESFWRMYVHLKRPSTLPRDANLYLFRDGLFPMWEEFPDGGCWILKVKKYSGVLSKMWQDLVFGAIGEMFNEPGVVGVTMATRTKEDMLSVWHRDNANQATRFHIGEKLKSILNLEKNTLIEYKTFARASSDKSTYSNTQAYVFAATAAGGAGGSTAGGSGSGKQGNRGGNNSGNNNSSGNNSGNNNNNNSGRRNGRRGGGANRRGRTNNAAATTAAAPAAAATE